MSALGGCAGLCRLALRRGLPSGLLVVFVALAVVVATRDPLGGVGSAPLDPERLEGANRALARHGVLALLGGLTLAWTSLSAALAGARWRAGDREWLAPRGASRAGVAAATWLGTWLAGCALLAGAVVAAEIAAGSGPPALTPRAELVGPRVVLLPGAREARWEVELPEGTGGFGEQVRARLAPAFGGGRAADVRFALERGALEAVSARVTAPTALTLPLPMDGGDGRDAHTLVATLVREGGTAAIALDPRGLALLAPSASERLGSLSVALALALAAGALAALSLGLASWMRPGLALLLVGALLLALTVHGERLGWSAELGPGRALEVLRGGLVPRLPGPRAVVAVTLTVALGLLMTTTGRVSGERGK